MKYFQFQITNLKEQEDDSIMIQIINVSNNIFLGREKTQNELLNLINATMSHELRNPLNSMCAQKVKVSYILKQLKEFALKLKSDLKTEVEKLINKLGESNEINNSSTDIMVYIIQNMQDYAHIKMGKFNKSLKEFDIKKAVEDVI